MHINVLKPI